VGPGFNGQVTEKVYRAAQERCSAPCPKRTGAELRWRPFLLGAVFKATGNVPPITPPNKGLYLVKDLQDWTRHLGLPPLRMPEDFPGLW
jgi:2-hydroxychromene-2-carboxylate isomerase